jgi:hypothetical protein
MRRDLQQRLAKLEARSDPGPPKFEVWVDDGSGILSNGEGETMTGEAYRAAYPDSIPIGFNIFDDERRPRFSKRQP